MVYSILKDECEPVPIRDEEMAVILALTSQGDTIGFSEVYKEGDRIEVISGPLKGLEGIIEKFDARKNRIKVRIQFLGKEKRIDLGAHLVNKSKKWAAQVYYCYRYKLYKPGYKNRYILDIISVW